MSQIPAYITNKAFSISALIYLFLAAYHFVKKNEIKEKYWSLAGLYAVTLHILISLVIFSKDYFPKFYDDALLSFSGEMVLVAGAAALLLLWNQNKNVKIRFWMMFFLSVHLFFIGYKGWLIINEWHGGMPPISLMSFLIAISGLILYLIFIFRNSKWKRRKN